MVLLIPAILGLACSFFSSAFRRGKNGSTVNIGEVTLSYTCTEVTSRLHDLNECTRDCLEENVNGIDRQRYQRFESQL